MIYIMDNITNLEEIMRQNALDITFRFDDNTYILGHTFILAPLCDTLRNIPKNSTIEISNISKHVFSDFIMYLYGQIIISSQNVMYLKELAKYFKCKSVLCDVAYFEISLCFTRYRINISKSNFDFVNQNFLERRDDCKCREFNSIFGYEEFTDNIFPYENLQVATDLIKIECESDEIEYKNELVREKMGKHFYMLPFTALSERDFIKLNKAYPGLITAEESDLIYNFITRNTTYTGKFKGFGHPHSNNYIHFSQLRRMSATIDLLSSDEYTTVLEFTLSHRITIKDIVLYALSTDIIVQMYEDGIKMSEKSVKLNDAEEDHDILVNLNIFVLRPFHKYKICITYKQITVVSLTHNYEYLMKLPLKAYTKYAPYTFLTFTRLSSFVRFLYFAG